MRMTTERAVNPRNALDETFIYKAGHEEVSRDGKRETRHTCR